MKDPSEVTTKRGGRASSEAPTSTLGGARDAVSDAPAIGTQIDRYTVLEQLGAGGMGEVYAAFDNKLDRKVALKLLRHRSDEYEARLMREAQAMARLLHPNVVAVFDRGITGNRLYLAMEFVRGKTLRGWQKEKSRSLDEVLRVYREAGEGLAAAHAVGLVHRDFKPDNVLIADDGRVKVTDFGIARATGENTTHTSGKRPSSRPPPRPDDAPSSSANTMPTSGSLDSPMTEEGALLGTPGYMAPEQFLCEAVDERTDQFSFCVSLYEALYGVRPFGGRGKASLEQIAQATLEGKIDDAPKGSTVPAHVRAVLLRGLSAEPPARYPSMRELLADLARDPRKQRRRRLAMAASALFTVATAATVAMGTARHRANLRAACAAEAGAIYTQWGGAQRDALQASMLADEGASTKSRTERTLKGLDAFAEAWKAEQAASCTATRLEKTQAYEAYEKRSACLLGAREGFDALVEILSERDPRVHRRATDMLGRLPPPRLCTGRAGERLYSPLPSEPSRRARAEQARELATRARVLSLSGRFKESVAMAERSAKLAREADMPSDEAVALAVAAANLGKAYDSHAAVSRAHEALRAAERAGDDHTAADAARVVAFELSLRLDRIEEGEAWLALAWAKLARLGKDDSLEMQLLQARAAVAYRRGDVAGAVEANGRAVQLIRDVLGARKDMCIALSSRAIFLTSTQDLAGALEAARASIVCEKDVGANPDMVFAYKAEGWVLYAQGAFAEAVEAFQHAVAAWEEVGPSESVATEAMAGIALAEVARGRLEQGEADARRAMHTIESRGPVSTLERMHRVNHAWALTALGRARAAAGDVRGARDACARALTDLEGGDGGLEVVDSLACLAEAELAAGEVAAARQHLERSITLTKRVLPGDLARAHFALARALAVPPMPDRPRARALAVQARDEFQRDAKMNPTLATAIAEVERWLAEHPEGTR